MKVVFDEPDGPAIASTSLWLARAVTLFSNILSFTSLLCFETTYTEKTRIPIVKKRNISHAPFNTALVVSQSTLNPTRPLDTISANE